ncbi:hypothetical protein M758_4G190600 [Ceratodon purpureus]|nr:hypothetical protein M758_4G190600 [Ceratodon purpureus]
MVNCRGEKLFSVNMLVILLSFNKLYIRHDGLSENLMKLVIWGLSTLVNKHSNCYIGFKFEMTNNLSAKIQGLWVANSKITKYIHLIIPTISLVAEHVHIKRNCSGASHQQQDFEDFIKT